MGIEQLPIDKPENRLHVRAFSLRLIKIESDEYPTLHN